MSCHNSPPSHGPCPNQCPCTPLGARLPNRCAPYNEFKCPVVCVPGTFNTEDLTVTDQLSMMIIIKVIEIFEDPALLCNTCDSGDVGQLICIDRCSIPFTGQEVTTIKLNLDSIDPNLNLGVVSINIYEKCNTIWFKLPCALLYDPVACSNPDPIPGPVPPPATVGSVSLTKSVGCPKEWTGRILLDGICYPILFKIKERTELIAQCGCPPFLQYTFDLVVECPFQKFFHSQSITCLDPVVGGTLIVTALNVQVKGLFFEYVLSQVDAIKAKYDCTTCAIGNNCSNAPTTCWST